MSQFNEESPESPSMSSDRILRGIVSSGDSTVSPSSFVSFQVMELVGQGGMGIVYRAMQDNPKRMIALKVMKNAARQHDVRRFQREVDILARLQHPGISRLYSVGEIETAVAVRAPFMAMEFIEGRTISEYCREQNLGLQEKLRLVIRVCEIMTFAHEHHVIHRDLKPSNILVDAAGQPTILDFGLSTFTQDVGLSSLTEDGQLLGTLDYMSPEQALGDSAGLDERTDVYSVGVILFELLAGRRPYELSSCSIIQAVQVIKTSEIARVSSANRSFRGDLDTIVAKALAKDRTQRYGSIQAFAADLTCVLAHEPIRARRSTLAYRARKFVRRNRTFLAVVLLIIASLTTALVLSFRAERRAEIEQRKAEAEERKARLALAYSRLSEGDALMRRGYFRDSRDANDDAGNLLESLGESVRPAEVGWFNLDLISPEPFRELESARDTISASAVSLQGKLALAFRDGHVEVREAAADAVLFSRPLREVSALRFSPNGEFLAVIGGTSPDVKVWDWTTNTEVPIGSTKGADAHNLTIGDSSLAFVTGRQLCIVPFTGEQRRINLPFTGLQSMTMNKSVVRLIDKDQKLWEFPVDGSPETSHPLPFGTMARLSPGGEFVAAVDNGVSIYRTADLKQTAHFDAYHSVSGMTFVNGSTLSISNFEDRTFDFVTADGCVVSRIPLSTVPIESNGTLSVALNPDGHQTLWASIPNLLRVVVPASESPISAAISADGKIAAVSLKGGRLQVIETSTGHKLLDSPMNEEVHHLACSKDGTKVATVSGRGQIQVWDVATRKSVSESPAAGTVAGFAMSSEGNAVYFSTLERSGATRLTYTAAGTQNLPFDLPFNVTSICLSYGGKRIAFVGSIEALIWDAERTRFLTPIHFQEPVLAAALVGGGGRLVTTNVQGGFSLWRIDTGPELSTSSWPVAPDFWCAAGDRILLEDADTRTLTDFDINDPVHRLHIEPPPWDRLRGIQWSADETRIIGIGSRGVTLLDISVPTRLRLIDRQGGRSSGPTWFDAAGIAR